MCLLLIICLLSVEIHSQNLSKQTLESYLSDGRLLRYADISLFRLDELGTKAVQEKIAPKPIKTKAIENALLNCEASEDIGEYIFEDFVADTNDVKIRGFINRDNAPEECRIVRDYYLGVHEANKIGSIFILTDRYTKGKPRILGAICVPAPSRRFSYEPDWLRNSITMQQPYKTRILHPTELQAIPIKDTLSGVVNFDKIPHSNILEYAATMIEKENLRNESGLLRIESIPEPCTSFFIRVEKRLPRKERSYLYPWNYYRSAKATTGNGSVPMSSVGIQTSGSYRGGKNDSLGGLQRIHPNLLASLYRWRILDSAHIRICREAVIKKFGKEVLGKQVLGKQVLTKEAQSVPADSVVFVTSYRDCRAFNVLRVEYGSVELLWKDIDNKLEESVRTPFLLNLVHSHTNDEGKNHMDSIFYEQKYAYELTHVPDEEFVARQSLLNEPVKPRRNASDTALIGITTAITRYHSMMQRAFDQLFPEDKLLGTNPVTPKDIQLQIDITSEARLSENEEFADAKDSRLKKSPPKGIDEEQEHTDSVGIDFSTPETAITIFKNDEPIQYMSNVPENQRFWTCGAETLRLQAFTCTAKTMNITLNIKNFPPKPPAEIYALRGNVAVNVPIIFERKQRNGKTVIGIEQRRVMVMINRFYR